MSVSKKKLWRGQMVALQALYGLYASREGWDADDRAERLAWASRNVGRDLGSFCELSRGEAAQLIDMMKRALGQEVKPAGRRLDRDAAMGRGSHGRRGHAVKVEVLATREALEEVDRLRERAGMTREGFESWLRSRQSPLCGRAEAKLLTIADCNRCRWALLNMLRRGAENGAATVQEVSAVAQ